MNLAGIILAAGTSSRMGSPKALLSYRGETFLDCLIGAFAPACSPVVVVLGHEPERIRAGVRRAGDAVFVVNEAYAKGQLSSLQCGLRALPPGPDGFLFTPVDYPAVLPETVKRLAEAFAASRPPVAQPRFDGRRGHPVCCAAGLIPEFLALPEDARARDVIHRYADSACHLDVNDPGVILDIDDPDAYAALISGKAGA